MRVRTEAGSVTVLTAVFLVLACVCVSGLARVGEAAVDKARADRAADAAALAAAGVMAAGGGDEQARDACNLPADEAHHQHVRPRRELRQRDGRGELLVVHELIDVDDLPVELRDQRRGAADGEKRRGEERGEKLPDLVLHARLPCHRRTAIATGQIMSTTAHNGQRRRPTATNVAAPKAKEAIVLSQPLASRAAVPKMRPAAADAAPAVAARTSGR